MFSAEFPRPQQINGINLENYIPETQSLNSVVFIHKKCLSKSQRQRLENKTNGYENVDVAKKGNQSRCEQRGKDKHEKCGRLTEVRRDMRGGTPPRAPCPPPPPPPHHHSVLEQTVKFVKNITPLIMPPANDSSPPFCYTVKTIKKHKNKSTPKRNVKTQTNADDENKKFSSKRMIETFHRETAFRESSSARESVSHSLRSGNTIEQIQLNQSLGTFSEISENKHSRHYVSQESYVKMNRNQEMKKFVTSESFEALATALSRTAGGTRIKIHLMDDQGKAVLTEGLQRPLVACITECVEELVKKCRVDRPDLTSVKKVVKCNSDKLDSILERLAFTPDGHTHKLAASTQVNMTPTATRQKVCVSTPRIPELKEESISDQDISIQHGASEKRYMNEGHEMTVLYPTEENSERNQSDFCADGVRLGCGEVGRVMEGSCDERPVIRPGLSQRIPTRFCWTDANRKF